MTDAIGAVSGAGGAGEFSAFVQHGGYIGIYLWFITIDQITPLPEEFSLILIGYLCASGIFNPVLAGALSLAGFLTMDIVHFSLARHGSRWLKRFVRRPSPFIARYRERFERNLPKTTLILCFIPRMRFFSPIFAGSSQAAPRRFFFFDTIGLAVFTVLYLLVGYGSSKGLGISIDEVTSVENIIFFAALAVGAAMVIVWEFRRRKKKRILNA